MSLRAIAVKITSLIASVAILSSCTKDDPAPSTPSGPVNANPPYFRWRVDQKSEVAADSAHAYTQSHTILAYTNAGEQLEIVVSSMATGTYQISSATGNSLQYIIGSKTQDGTGTLSITNSGNTTLSGSFNCTLAGGTNSVITGSFVDVPKKVN